MQKQALSSRMLMWRHGGFSVHNHTTTATTDALKPQL